MRSDGANARVLATWMQVLLAPRTPPFPAQHSTAQQPPTIISRNWLSDRRNSCRAWQAGGSQVVALKAPSQHASLYIELGTLTHGNDTRHQHVSPAQAREQAKKKKKTAQKRVLEIRQALTESSLKIDSVMLTWRCGLSICRHKGRSSGSQGHTPCSQLTRPTVRRPQCVP